MSIMRSPDTIKFNAVQTQDTMALNLANLCDDSGDWTLVSVSVDRSAGHRRIKRTETTGRAGRDETIYGSDQATELPPVQWSGAAAAQAER